MQISASDPSNPAPIPNVITLNLGDMTSTGVELQGAWAPTEHLTFDFSGYYGNPKYTSGTRDLNIARVPPHLRQHRLRGERRHQRQKHRPELRRLAQL